MTPAAPPITLLGVSLCDRWAELDGSLRALAHGLERELAPLAHAPFPVPPHKARLTRLGGRCQRDGTPLTFDPWLPTTHVCPTCGVAYTGREHDDWWAMGAQLWSAERVLHTAMLGVMQQRDDLLALSARGLEALSVAWPTYANRDNALGPTRPFFSAYLESVWLLNLSLAAQLLTLWPAAHRAVQQFCDTVAEPSRAIIRSYPEGHSNRQAWHVAARLTAGTLLGDTRDVEDALAGTSGLLELLEHGLLPDGSWYEGENYHLFAHRGLWYGVMAAEALGYALPDQWCTRFHAGFRTPLLGILPDGTFPARRDSRYATSVHQWRFAEWCELGLARGHDPVVAAWMQRLYRSAHAEGDSGRARSTADIERDEPACALTRADLGWRTLLFARAHAWPATTDEAMPSVVLEAQGLTVLRQDAGRLYVALEGGHTGGGHGHPDRLALTLQDGDRRVLQDPGTGSYVEKTLHWYRSTLAHNAPLINGRSQQRVATELLAFEAHETVGWMRARARDIAPGVSVARTIVLSDDHVVDVVAWQSEHLVDLSLPMHGAADAAFESDARSLLWHHASATGAGGLEDGFDFLEHVARAPWPADETVRLQRLDVAPARAWIHVRGIDLAEQSLWRAISPGPPRGAPRPVHWVQARGRAGTISTLWSLRGRVEHVRFGGLGAPHAITVRLITGAVVQHTPVDDDRAANRWQLDVIDGASRRTVTLHGARVSLADEPSRRSSPRDIALPAPIPLPLVRELGAAHYRRSEQRWEEAGAPTATVSIAWQAGELCLEVDARTGALAVPPVGAINDLDNERVDVNADGVQLYLGRCEEPEWSAAWLLVPERETGRLRITPLVSPALANALTGHWEPTADGWRCRLTVSSPLVESLSDSGGVLRVDLIVNERPPERVRRRGQLLLSGSNGEFVYLRGDRHEPARALFLRVGDPSVPMTTSARSA